MSRVQTKVFKSNQSQAVRLPKPVALPEHVREVDVVAIGDTRIITPAGRLWDDWFATAGVTDDFMQARQQPLDQERDSF